MEIKKLDSPVSISDSALVRLKEMGNITEIMYSEKRSRGGYITKIDKDHYVDNRTGELLSLSISKTVRRIWRMLQSLLLKVGIF